MQLLISDANILIDMEAGALMAILFQLPMRFGIPDILYFEEIEAGSPNLEKFGLQIMEVTGEFVKYAVSVQLRYEDTFTCKTGKNPSHNDYLALALAKQESCTLLTGDANLRTVASKEQVPVMGTIGLLCEMVKNQLLTVEDALKALYAMKENNRRLPWLEAENMILALR